MTDEHDERPQHAADRTDEAPGTEHPAHHDHEHHELADALRGGVDEGSGEPGDATMDQLVADAIGGWRGMLDSGLPSVVFAIAYVGLASYDQRLAWSLWAALGVGIIVAVVRLVRRQSLRQVLAGIPILVFSAWLTSRTGRPETFYLPGLLLNAGSALVFLVSIVVGHPVVGYFVGALTGDITGWRAVPEQRRAYTLATWFFFGTYVVRVLVKLPLYWAANVAALGTIGLLLGWPLTALAAYFSYLVIAKARREAPIPPRPAGEAG